MAESTRVTQHDTDKAELNLSKGWLQGIVLVMIFDFFVMGMLAMRTYTDSMPLPESVNGPDGEIVYTHQDITAGQQTFLRRGLRQYGSIMGHGAYLGPELRAIVRPAAPNWPHDRVGSSR